MPGTYRAPGVYVEELPSGVRPVVGVSTSTAAFVDAFARGPVNKAVRIDGPGTFDRIFGGVWTSSEASYAIRQFFINGGSTAWVVRVLPPGAKVAATSLPASGGGGGGGGPAPIPVGAKSEGAWGGNLVVGVQYPAGSTTTFDVVVGEKVTVVGKSKIAVREIFRGLTHTAGAPRFFEDVVNTNSSLVTIGPANGAKPAETWGTHGATDPPKADDIAKSTFPADFVALNPGADGNLPGTAGFDAAKFKDALVGAPGAGTGMWALDIIAPEIFNILCVPAMALLTDTSRVALLADTAEFCTDRRAMLLVDPPAAQDDTADAEALGDAMSTFAASLDPHPNAAVYFPRLVIPDPVNGDRPRAVGPSGTIAGIWARTDDGRGVWKAPAGTDATLRGADLVRPTTEATSEVFNPIGVNVLRTFPVYHDVVWGSRTLAGADLMASQWKYVPVRRTALFIEESLRQGLQWVVFEPNDEPLWAQIRLNVGAFMQRLFRLGAFAGTTPAEAYLVKCDADTTAPDDVSRGVVNILVGFQPLLPCEFVVIQIQQLTRPTEV